MKPYDSGQSLWMEHITREQLYSGLLKQYIEDWRVTGLTIDPGACAHVCRRGTAYDYAIRKKLKDDLFGEPLALELILEDTHHAADFMRHVFDRTDGVDGWTALTGPSPPATDTAAMVAAVSTLYTKLRRPNILMNVPGLSEWCEAIELLVLSGIPINITLIFSREQYLKAANAYLHGTERRIAAGLRPVAASFVSVPISPLIAELAALLGENSAVEIGVAIARRIYKASRGFHLSPQWERACNSGARPLRLAWVTGRYDERNTTSCYLRDLAAPFTVAAMPWNIFEAHASQTDLAATMPIDGGDCEDILIGCRRAAIDLDALAARLQQDEAETQATTWIRLLEAVACKSADLAQTKYQTTPKGNGNTGHRQTNRSK